MKQRAILALLAILLVCGPAWAKGRGGGHGQGHGQGHDTGKEHHDGPPEGSLPPGLAKQDKMPRGLEQQGKTPEGWRHGKKKGWWHRLWNRGDNATPE
jgi:hypothetical protein